MKLEIGARSAGSRPLCGLGLRRRPGRGVLLAEYALLVVLAVVVGGFAAREFGAGVNSLFAVAAGML
ncbi:MAG TPA: hypothetical protein VHT92_10885 [Candidatus Cybelea sp.]|nr:hypothetical protein [Candidatus Cybelea sp.]